MTKTVWQLRVSNWSCGILTALVSLTLGSQVLRLYALITDRSPFHLDVSPLTMLVTFVALDVLYYAQHRAEHRVKWLWRMHSVHHLTSRR